MYRMDLDGGGKIVSKTFSKDERGIPHRRPMFSQPRSKRCAELCGKVDQKCSESEQVCYDKQKPTPHDEAEVVSVAVVRQKLDVSVR